MAGTKGSHDLAFPLGSAMIPIMPSKVPSSAHLLQVVMQYHERSKHHPDRYARSLGYLDWEHQPDPFRTYAGCERFSLPCPPQERQPNWNEVLNAKLPVAPLDPESLSHFLYYSMAISAWKQVAGGPPWALRVNPSSGNLHPTEAWLILPGMALLNQPGVFHYSPMDHHLELRRKLKEAAFAHAPAGGFFCALSTIAWRESWKYGERAFRYCQHDVGHAIAAISLSARLCGWECRIIDHGDDRSMAKILGLNTEGEEAEHADVLLAIGPDLPVHFASCWNPEILDTLAPAEGIANTLSQAHHPWPIVQEMAEATQQRSVIPLPSVEKIVPSAPILHPSPSATQLIRQRRSAQKMDGHSHLKKQDFFSCLQHTIPTRQPFPYSALNWDAQIHLLLFVHRVMDLTPGVYLLIRNQKHTEHLLKNLGSDFLLAPMSGEGVPADFFLLEEGDAKQIAQQVSCHQDIASDGAFSLSMISRFQSALEEAGAPMYRRLYWECGVLGQMLYLEAERLGLKGTGIGCFFDDAVHRLLGFKDLSYQDLYHFTVGGAMEDPRIQTMPAYPPT